MGNPGNVEEGEPLISSCDEIEDPTRIRSCVPDEVRPHCKTLILALGLLLAGCVFTAIGMYILYLPDPEGPHSYVFFICGFICIIPGGYHVFYMCKALRGSDGYHMEDLPKYEN